MAGLRNIKLKATTLPEALIALTIVTVVMAVAYSVIAGQGETVNSVDKFKAMVEINNRINSEVSIEEYCDTLAFENIKLIETNGKFRGNSKLFCLRVKAISKRGIVFYERSIVRKVDGLKTVAENE
jgi:hypothetical protein